MKDIKTIDSLYHANTYGRAPSSSSAAAEPASGTTRDATTSTSEAASAS